MENESIFSERQGFKQIWLWALLLGINAIFLFLLVGQVLLGYKFGNNPLSNIMMFVIFISTLLPTALVFYSRLETEIKSDGIYVRFFPIQLSFKFYPWNNLNQIFVREYSPVGEFGGWGIRGMGKNKALNISGNKGIQLVTKNGSKLLIGTGKPDEAAKILKQLGHLTE